MRRLDRSFDPDAVARVDEAIASIRQAERVDILIAVESGSRAWGFPSPDSDYDCRFIYRRRLDDYLSLFPHRDVIERPLDAVLDVHGWDLAKTLRLLLKGNAVAVEWLTSPFVYGGIAAFRDDCTALARAIVSQEAVARHYLHLGESQRRPADGQQLPLKRIFYVLRPAVALRWLAERPGEAVAPMHFPTLLAESPVPPPVLASVSDLLARKAVTRELGSGSIPPEIAAYIDESFLLARRIWPKRAAPPTAERSGMADAFFRRWVRDEA